MPEDNLFAEGAQLGVPYWWEDVDWPSLEAPPLKSVDLLVIGAGYTGLSAAIAAHDAGARVAVIDAGKPGRGASTRNGGMVGAHPRLPWEALRDRFGVETADALFAEAATVLDWVRDLITREQIYCDYQETGRIQLAYTKAQFQSQERLAGYVNAKSSARCHMVNAQGLAAEVNTPLYCGGLLYPDHGSLHPAKYHRGMLDAVLRRSVPVAADCRASSVIRDRGRFKVTSQRGDICADRIILATNGYTGDPFHWFASRVFPLPSFMIATEPLSADLIATLAPGGRIMVETRARHSYFRISPDGSRILFGGRASMLNVDLATAARRLKTTMCEIWPQLSQTRITHAWTGNTGYSFNHLPHVGEQDGLHYALGFSGSGTALAPYLGAKAARRALGAEGGETSYARTGLNKRWYYRGGSPHFLRLADFWYRSVVDRRETRASRL